MNGHTKNLRKVVRLLGVWLCHVRSWALLDLMQINLSNTTAITSESRVLCLDWLAYWKLKDTLEELHETGQTLLETINLLKHSS